MWDQRTILLLGQEKYKQLQQSHVIVIGLGGVGSYAAEFLVRAGIGQLTIVDHDTVQPSNINRQVQALHSVLGQKKASVLAERLKDINPNLKLNVYDQFLHQEQIQQLLQKHKYDYLIDAIDTLTPKLFVIQTALQLGIPLVSAMGSGGRFDPTQIKIADISQSYGDKFARHIRKKLHKLGIYSGFTVVFSPEPRSVESLLFVDEPNKKTTLGTISYIPAVFGAYCAYVVIRDITKFK